MNHALERIDPSFGQKVLNHASIGDLDWPPSCFVCIGVIVKPEMLARSCIWDIQCIGFAIVWFSGCLCLSIITKSCLCIYTRRGR